MKADISFDTTLRDHHMTFHSTWGLFSPKQIDHGSKVLVELVELPKNADVLDLGCGYGPIGLTLGKEASTVHLVDKDFVAIDYTKQNAKLNKVQNCEIYLSNGFSHVPKNQKFDVIVSNIPAKVGKEMLQIIMKDAKKHLKKNGKLYVVTIAGLKDFIKRNFKEIFGNYKKLKQSKGYSVALAEKSN